MRAWAGREGLPAESEATRRATANMATSERNLCPAAVQSATAAGQRTLPPPPSALLLCSGAAILGSCCVLCTPAVVLCTPAVVLLCQCCALCSPAALCWALCCWLLLCRAQKSYLLPLNYVSKLDSFKTKMDELNLKTAYQGLAM